MSQSRFGDLPNMAERPTKVSVVVWYGDRGQVYELSTFELEFQHTERGWGSRLRLEGENPVSVLPTKSYVRESKS